MVDSVPSGPIGKYYLFLNNLEFDAKQLWLDEKNHELLAIKTDKNWVKLSITHN